jgi:radical SAM enzyme (TIGR01210 family)
MGLAAERRDRPHFFLHRPFMGDQDLLIIFNSKRCRYQCYFCELPAKSSKNFISAKELVKQFEYVMEEMKHSLSVLSRVTLSNEGSMLDVATFPIESLLCICEAINEVRVVRRIVLETRVEFCDPGYLESVKQCAPRCTLDILTGFETVDKRIRDTVIFKRETLDEFKRGLDSIAAVGADLTCYVLFKPDPAMSDSDAMVEARQTYAFLAEECAKRNLRLRIRLNPMYLARGSKWAELATRTPGYQPPRLTDVMRFAEEMRAFGTRVYVGLSTEGLDDGAGTFYSREDFRPELIKPIKQFNDDIIRTFDWDKISYGDHISSRLG